MLKKGLLIAMLALALYAMNIASVSVAPDPAENVAVCCPFPG